MTRIRRHPAQIGAGKGYEYPHAHGGWVAQDYKPEELVDRRYFEPITGVELTLAEQLEHKRGGGKDDKVEP